MKFYQSGRSMIEMLGVLAIIGVLSVGAISGYAKAMFKYKLNKQSEQLTYFFNSIIRYSKSWNFSQSTNIIPYLIKINEIPQEMVKSGETAQIYDIFNNQITVTWHPSSQQTEIDIKLDASKGDNNSLDTCRNIANITKEFHENIRYLSSVNYGSGDESSETASVSSLYGDSYCNGRNVLCLRDATVEQIDNLCRFNLDKNKSPHMEILTH